MTVKNEEGKGQDALEEFRTFSCLRLAQKDVEKSREGVGSEDEVDITKTGPIEETQELKAEGLC